MMSISKQRLLLLLFASNTCTHLSFFADATTQNYLRRGEDNESLQQVELVSNESTPDAIHGNNAGATPTVITRSKKTGKNGNGNTVQAVGGFTATRGERHLKSKKNSKNYGYGYGIYSVPGASPTRPPTKSRPSLRDWTDTCAATSAAIDRCIIALSDVAKPENCKMCLKGLASFADPPPPDESSNNNGVRLCAASPTCGQCTKDDILPFYACGFSVDRAFFGASGTATAASTAASTSTTSTASIELPSTELPSTNVTVVDAPLPPPVLLDEVNCPAVWPGTGTVCVMLPGFNAKECVYPEYSLAAVCKCSDPLLIWDCVNGPAASLTVGAGIGVSGSSTTGGTDPVPILGTDAMINSLP